jgi:hypothetical protein
MNGNCSVQRVAELSEKWMIHFTEKNESEKRSWWRWREITIAMRMNFFIVELRSFASLSLRIWVGTQKLICYCCCYYRCRCNCECSNTTQTNNIITPHKMNWFLAFILSLILFSLLFLMSKWDVEETERESVCECVCACVCMWNGRWRNLIEHIHHFDNIGCLFFETHPRVIEQLTIFNLSKCFKLQPRELFCELDSRKVLKLNLS